MGTFSLILFLSIAGACGYLLWGFVGFRMVLNANKCKMTYSRPARFPVVFNISEWNYGLRKISHANNAKLNAQPVLFIPGHLGSHDQSRSFASDIPDMHNMDNEFQYFALDFNGDPTAFHAGDIMNKAVFVNEALKFIESLYDARGKGNPNVMILAHSYGGMIARTSMLLSNHPKCLVNTMVMLSSPFTRPPYSPDSSLHQLFTQVNKAWFTASYNASADCLLFPSRDFSRAITFNHQCPSHCVGKTRIISISGGEIDPMVPVDSTDVFHFSARPRNSTLSGPKSNVYTLEKYSEIKQLLKGFFSSATAKMLNLAKYFTFAAEGSPDNISSDEVAQPQTQEPTITNPNSPYAYITRSLWQDTIMPYSDPRHISLRSSQLRGVSCPIDHFAMLWCHQLLQIVHDSMLKLSRVSDDEPIDFKDILPLHASFEQAVREAVDEVKVLGIDNLENFVARNISQGQFFADQQRDLDSITAITGNAFWTSAVVFWASNLGKIAGCTVGMLIISISNFLLHELMGLKTSKSWILRKLGIDAYSRLGDKIGKLMSRNATEVSIFAGIIVAIIAGYLAKNDMLTMRNLLEVRNTFVCVLVAMGMKVILQFAVEMLRILVFIVMWPFRTILLFLLDKFPYKYLQRSAPPLASVLHFLANHLLDLLAIAILSSVLFLASKKSHFGTLGRANVILSSGTVCFYSLSAFLMILLCSVPPKGEKTKIELSQNFLALSLIALGLGTPSFVFALKQLFGAQPAHLNIFELPQSFGPDRINCGLSLLALFLHLKTAFLSSKEIQPMNFFKTMMKSKKSSVNKNCYHEDGGPRAVFVAIDAASTIVVERIQHIRGDEIVMGPTFKVISCDCPMDPSLKSFDEWCEFCKCENCGGKGYIRHRSDVNDGPAVTINLDFALWALVALVGSYAIVFSCDQLYMNFYAAIIVACMCLTRQYFSRSQITVGV